MTKNNVKEISIYRRLAEHLDRLPGGLAPSETDADIRLLKGLFTEEETELAIHLTLDKETAEIIGNIANIRTEIAEKRFRKWWKRGSSFPINQGQEQFYITPHHGL